MGINCIENAKYSIPNIMIHKTNFQQFDSQAGYTTTYGKCVYGDSIELLNRLENNSINLVITNPPFALLRKKEYGNENQKQYVDWICQFGKLVYQKLKDNGSFVIDLGGAYKKGQPTYSLYQFKTLIKLCDEIGFHLAQPFYWHNPSTLPAPIEWVNKRKLRAKSSVNTVWWLCKSPFCKADVTNALTPYSARMERLISNPEEFLKEEGTVRPSSHVLRKSSWNKNNGGAIPSNLLQISNSESNSQYLRYCKKIGIKGHPARFPSKLPEFFIKFLTQKGDLVIDIFCGSNTTGKAAEKLNRNWLSFDLSQEYIAASVFRFSSSEKEANENYSRIISGEHIIIPETSKMIL